MNLMFNKVRSLWDAAMADLNSPIAISDVKDIADEVEETVKNLDARMTALESGVKSDVAPLANDPNIAAEIVKIKSYLNGLFPHAPIE